MSGIGQSGLAPAMDGADRVADLVGDRVSLRLRAARAMPRAYSIITLIQWIFGAVWPLTIPMQDDTFASWQSALGAIGIPEDVVSVLGIVSISAFILLLIIGLVTLFRTIDTVQAPTS